MEYMILDGRWTISGKGMESPETKNPEKLKRFGRVLRGCVKLASLARAF